MRLPAWPLQDFLTGSWKLERTSSDGSSFNGTAVFSPLQDNRVRLFESGTLITLGGVQIVGERSWIWQFHDPHRLQIFYDEATPRLYHDLTFTESDDGWTAQAEHLCVSDNYSGTYHLSSDRITIETTVNGPDKNYRLNSRLIR